MQSECILQRKERRPGCPSAAPSRRASPARGHDPAAPRLELQTGRCESFYDGRYQVLGFLHERGASCLLGDASRTFLVGGSPTQEQRDLYHQACEYVQAVADVVRAGRTHAEVLELLPPVPGKYQPQQDNYHVVHSVGIVPQGYPKVDRQRTPDDDTFKENQILAIECYFGEVGSDLAVKLEEMIRVRRGPPEFITGGVPYEASIVPASGREPSSA